MFRALNLFPSSNGSTPITTVVLEAPLSVTLIDPEAKTAPPVQLAIAPDAIFTTAVGHSSKRTLASWHVTTPQEIVEHMLEIVEDEGTASRSYL